MSVRQWLGKDAAALCRAYGQSDPVLAMQIRASELLDEIEFGGPPVDLEVMASFRGVSAIHRLPMLSAACLVPTQVGLEIHVNQVHSRGKQNFSIAHEISHTLLPHYDRRLIDDTETGLFSSSREEEYLCDVGAAALLMNSRWLGPLASRNDPSISALCTLADEFEVSLQAIAYQIAELGVWPCAFVFWEMGLRKGDRISDRQASIPGFEIYGEPLEKLRITAGYPRAWLGRHIPLNKSVPATSLIGRCCEAEPFTFGMEDLDLGHGIGTIKVYCESIHAPYRSIGTIRHRVISMLLPANPISAPRHPSVLPLEVF